MHGGCVNTCNESLANCSLDLANKSRHVLFAMLFYIFMSFPGKANLYIVLSGEVVSGYLMFNLHMFYSLNLMCFFSRS